MGKFSLEAKVGIFVLTSVAILFWMTFRLSHISEKRIGYKIYAVFDSVHGIYEASPIFIAGVKIGYVEKIELMDGRAKVTLRIKPEYKIKVDAKAEVKTQGLLGSSYINIIQGKATSRDIEPGEFLEETTSPIDFATLSKKLSDISDDIKGVTETFKNVLGTKEGEKDIREFLNNLKDLSISIRQIADSNKEDIRDIVKNIKEFSEKLSEDIDRLIGNASSIIEENRGEIKDAVSSIRDAGERLKKTIASLNIIVDDVKEGKGTVGKLLRDEETAKKVDDAISAIDSMVKRARRLEFILKYRGEWMGYNPAGSDNYSYYGSKHFFGLRIQPREDKFYEFDVVSVPSEDVLKEYGIGDNGQRYNIIYRESSIKFSAFIAKRIKFLTFRGGIIQSSGGLGVDIQLIKNYLNFTIETYEFSKDTNPNIKAFFDIALFKYFFFTAGAEDIINSQGRPHYFVGGGIQFSDDDIKSILGFAGSAAIATSGY